MSMTLDPPEYVAQPPEPNDAMSTMTFRCCNERIKFDPGASTVHCVICGTATTVV
jgi:LSD1 subclass zinc finger protein